ncbi:hypothetical protein [Sporosarcina sp. P33]|uniref:hypothetical protein n=1 Tax=Sporosarcina sp. P33 TaxID=1930764 RepID=UPI0009C16044|nr:hypothetical protein [Sporosarcina sp. P33]ARD48414.1 hypothetical protein SporoP33_09360 [Sporosarcina sp. P33]
MNDSKRFELRFRNPEVRIYAAVVLPAVILGLLVILFSGSEFNYLFAALLQSAALAGFYSWRFIFRRKEKFKESG